MFCYVHVNNIVTILKPMSYTQGIKLQSHTFLYLMCCDMCIEHFKRKHLPGGDRYKHTRTYVLFTQHRRYKTLQQLVIRSVK